MNLSPSKKILFALLYFGFLILISYFAFRFNYYRFQGGEWFLALQEVYAGYLFIVLSSIVIAVTIVLSASYSSIWLASVWLLSLAWIYYLETNGPEVGGLASVGILFIITLGCIATFLFRVLIWPLFLRINNNRIKILIALLPIVVVFCVIGIDWFNIVNISEGYCAKVELPAKVFCYQELAFKTKNPIMCLKIVSMSINTSEYCLGQLKNEIKPEMCVGLDGDDQFTCYLIVAEKFHDVSVCENIRDSYRREGCRRAIELGQYYFGHPL